MNVSKELGAAIDGYYGAFQELCDVLSKEDGFNSRLKVIGELSIVVNAGFHQLIEKAFGNKPNTRHEKGGPGCNGGNCERHKLGAEPCSDCPFCDEKGNI